MFAYQSMRSLPIKFHECLSSYKIKYNACNQVIIQYFVKAMQAFDPKNMPENTICLIQVESCSSWPWKRPIEQAVTIHKDFMSMYVLIKL